MRVARRAKNQKQKKTVAVFFGGQSFEREISVLTGVFVLNVLKAGKYDLLPVYVDGAGDFFTSPEMYDVRAFSEEKRKKFTKIFILKEGAFKYGTFRKISKIDCVLNCCHGGWGEGGGVSALAEMLSLPLAAPSLALSALFMDKVLSKPLLSGMGIPVVPFVALRKGEEAGAEEKVEDALGYPVIVKPATLGSSIGVAVARDREQLKKAVENGFCFDEKLLVEKYLSDKRDVNCAAYRAEGEIHVSECEEPFSADEILSFREKYLTGGKERRSRLPAEIDQTLATAIRETTEKIYKTLGFTGVVRLDYLVCGEKFYFNELNAVPGSLAYYLFTPKITQAEKFFSSLVDEALKTGVATTRAYPSFGVLDSPLFFKGKK